MHTLAELTLVADGRCTVQSKNRKVIETFNLVETQRCTRVTIEANLRSEEQGQGHWRRKCKIVFAHIFIKRLSTLWAIKNETHLFL